MDVVTLCRLPVGVLWWESPARTLTVVIKGTFSLEGRGEARLAARQEPLSLDRPSAAGDADELEYASDFAPCKARADVFLVGHARAAAPATAIPVRLAVGELDLRLFAVARAPAAEIPLVARHLRRDPADAVPSPVGPRAPWAPERSALAGAGWIGEDGLPAVPLLERFDHGFFNAAPRAQQIRAIDPWGALVLEGLLPGKPQHSLRLPAMWPRVFLLDGAPGERGSEGAAPLAELDLRCDTLWIDVDRALCTLTWRGHHVVEPGGAEPGSLVVALASALDEAGWGQIRDRLDDALVASPISAAELREAQRPPASWTPEQAGAAPAAIPRTLEDDLEAETTLPRHAGPATSPPTLATLDDTEVTLPRHEGPATAAPAPGSAFDFEDEETLARDVRAQTLDDADLVEVEGTRSVRPSQMSPVAPAPAPAFPAAPAGPDVASDATLTLHGVAPGIALPFLPPAAQAARVAPPDPGLRPGEPSHEELTQRTITSIDPPSADTLPFLRGPAPAVSRTRPPESFVAPALPFAPAPAPPALARTSTVVLLAQSPAPAALPFSPAPSPAAALLALSPAPAAAPAPSPAAALLALSSAPAAAPAPSPAAALLTLSPAPAAAPAPALAPAPAPAFAPAPAPAFAPAPAPALAPAAAPAPPPAPARPLAAQPALIPPATYAAVRAALREGNVSLEEVLAPHGIEPSDWHANERRQTEALAEEARRGEDALAVALFEAMRAAEQRGAAPEDGELSLGDYVAVQLEVEAAEDPAAALAARGISAAAWRRLQQRWRTRALAQRGVAEALRRALAEGRGKAGAAPPTPDGGPGAPRPGARAAP